MFRICEKTDRKELIRKDENNLVEDNFNWRGPKYGMGACFSMISLTSCHQITRYWTQNEGKRC